MEKIVLNVMTEKGFEVLKSVILIHKEILAFVVIGKDSNIENDFSDEIAKLCELNSLQYFFRGREPSADKNHYIFAISWRWMIKHPSNKLIVFHDSLLPKYRGFAPLVNMLINGEKQIGVSAIFGASEYDKGDIIEQKSTSITYPLKIADAVKINNNNFLALVEILLKKISKSNKIIATPQSELNASYSIWRDFDDYYIDWSQSASEIKRLIDAVGSPYLGARSRISNGDEIVIEDAEVVADVYCELRHIGKVIFVEDEKPIIVCGSGLLKLTKASILKGDFFEDFLPLKSFRLRFK
jgi:methionyl-tRNA formyltransferase